MVKKVSGELKSFFTACQMDGAWVDLVTFGPSTYDGKEISEDRAPRYIRSRARRIEEQGTKEVSRDTPLREEAPATPVPNQAGEGEEVSQKPQVVLSINPSVVKSIFEFLAMEEEDRQKAVLALHALSMSSGPFKQAVEVMLDDAVELVVDIAEGPAEGNE